MIWFLIKDELIHLALALLVAGFFYFKNRDWRLILAALLFGFFIDIDHLFDYFAYFGMRFNLTDFLNVTTYMSPAERIYVLFHGWEFVPVLWLMARWFEKKLKIKYLAWTASLAYLIHLLWDSYLVPAPFIAYSFIYRFLNNFSLESFNAF